jgi:hypothetical protein
MGRTYTGIGPYLLKIGNKPFLSVLRGARIKPGTRKSTREEVLATGIFIFKYLNIHFKYSGVVSKPTSAIPN